MSNGEIITSTHTELLFHPDFPLQARKAHTFPGLNKALLFIGILCDHGCEATFNNKYLHILNKQSGKIIMKGTRETRTNLYMSKFTQQNKLMTESTTPDEYFSGSTYNCNSKSTLVDYHRASFWGLTQSGWGKQPQKTYSLPGEAYHLTWCIKVYIKKQSTILGHLQKPQKFLRSTQ